eukprot:3230022-Prymnesium_polylepis.1
MIKTDLKPLCSGAFSDMLCLAPIDQTKISLAPPTLKPFPHLPDAPPIGVPSKLRRGIVAFRRDPLWSSTAADSSRFRPSPSPAQPHLPLPPSR